MLMVEGGKAPFPKTAAKSLRTLLKENGIAQQELEILKQAENKSDALVSVEKNAFELIEKDNTEPHLNFFIAKNIYVVRLI